MTASRVSAVFQQGISVKNTRTFPLSRLIVKDQVPISTDAQIKVNVLEPALPEVKMGWSRPTKDIRSTIALNEVIISGNKDLRARWTRSNEDDEATQGSEVNAEGLMEWICRVEPNSSIELKLGWEVNVPKGFKWSQY
jgi:hypothetical protein